MGKVIFSSEKKDILENDYSWSDVIRGMWIFLRPHKGRVVFSVGLMILAEIIGLLPTLAVGQVVNILAESLDINNQQLHLWFTVLISAQILFALFSSFSRLIGYRLSEHAAVSAKQSGLNHLFRLDLNWHVRENSGNKLKRIDRGAQAVDGIFRTFLRNIIQVAVRIIGVLIILLTISRTVAFMMAFFMVTYFLVARYFNLNGARAGHQVNIQDEKINGLMFEIVNSIRSVKVLAIGQKLIKKLQIEFKNFLSLAYRRIGWYQYGNVAQGTWSGIMRSLV